MLGGGISLFWGCRGLGARSRAAGGDGCVAERGRTGGSGRAIGQENEKRVGGGDRIHPENARMSGRHGVQYVAQCVASAALTPVVWQ